MRAIGRNCTIIIHATAVADPVRSSSKANTATELNQSPSCETVWPKNSRRKFRLVRRMAVWEDTRRAQYKSCLSVTLRSDHKSTTTVDTEHARNSRQWHFHFDGSALRVAAVRSVFGFRLAAVGSQLLNHGGHGGGTGITTAQPRRAPSTHGLHGTSTFISMGS